MWLVQRSLWPELASGSSECEGVNKPTKCLRPHDENEEDSYRQVLDLYGEPGISTIVMITLP